MKTIIAAISGGVDSVTMLDILETSHSNVIVAHFNHGIRSDSDEDEQLVGELAAQYGFKYERKKEDLGADASETYARERRYKFLNEVATKYNGTIYTAHHADDVVETIALNLIRGTGWRGLTPLDNPDIIRPLIGWWKSDIRDYVEKNQLRWREDSTNLHGEHLRNRVRKALRSLDLQEKKKLLELYQQQKTLKRQIDTLVSGLTTTNRQFFREADDAVALEVLRAICTKQNITPLRKNLKLALDAIRTFKNGKKFELNKYVTIKMNRDDFELI